MRIDPSTNDFNPFLFQQKTHTCVDLSTQFFLYLLGVGTTHYSVLPYRFEQVLPTCLKSWHFPVFFANYVYLTSRCNNAVFFIYLNLRNCIKSNILLSFPLLLLSHLSQYHFLIQERIVHMNLRFQETFRFSLFFFKWTGMLVFQRSHDHRERRCLRSDPVGFSASDTALPSPLFFLPPCPNRHSFA